MTMDFTECWSDTCSNVAIAARIGNIEYLRFFLQQNKPVDASDNRGWKPLHEAAALSPSIPCLEELLKHEDTNINWVTHEGETALLLACKRRTRTNASEVVKLLLQYGANPNIKDNEEDTPLLAAVRSGLTEVVEQLIDAGANVNARDCSKWSPLHEAASKNDIRLLKSLLRKGACIDKKDECGMTPLFTAAQHGAESCLKELLHVARHRGQENVVNVGAEDWATPLMIAAQQGFVNCVRYLLEYGANPDLRTSDQATALHLAVQGNHKLCLDILLEKMHLQPLIAPFHPMTYQPTAMISPVHLAVEFNSHECLRSLLAAGFSPDSIFACTGLVERGHMPYQPENETALSYAVSKCNKLTISILLSAGASCNPPLPRTCHPILRAMHNETMEEFYLLIEHGTDVNYQRPQDPTNEVFLNCLLTEPKYIKPLLYHGCDPNLCFQGGHEIFTRCCYRFITLSVKSSSVLEFLRFLLRFLIITKNVQNAIHLLGSRMQSDVKDLLLEIDQPSSLKQMCFIRIRQHLYSIHGVKLPNIISHLHLPPRIEEYIACRDLQDPSIHDSMFVEPLEEITPDEEEI